MQDPYSKGLVVSDGCGQGSLVWYNGVFLESEVYSLGRDLSELGLDGAPLGISIWEGVYITEDEDPEFGYSTVPVGSFRSLTEEEWDLIRAGKNPLDGLGPEPGQLILKTSCPCCGANLAIEHGDEPGGISVIGSPEQ